MKTKTVSVYQIGRQMVDEIARLRAVNAELVACCERALNESARVHPEFHAQLQKALAKARREV